MRKCACGEFLLPGLVPRPGPALEEAVSLWLEVGSLPALEQALLAGYGHLLEGRASRLPRVAAFLRNLPLYQGRIAEVHAAAAAGRLTDLARHLEGEEQQTWASSRDMKAGTTPLQKAMLGRHVAAAKLLMRRAPCTLHATDRMGRTPLHYAAALDTVGCEAGAKGAPCWYKMLVDAGAEEGIVDALGRTPEFYQTRCMELLKQQRGPRAPQGSLQGSQGVQGILKGDSAGEESPSSEEEEEEAPCVLSTSSSSGTEESFRTDSQESEEASQTPVLHGDTPVSHGETPVLVFQVTVEIREAEELERELKDQEEKDRRERVTVYEHPPSQKGAPRDHGEPEEQKGQEGKERGNRVHEHPPSQQTDPRDHPQELTRKLDGKDRGKRVTINEHPSNHAAAGKGK